MALFDVRKGDKPLLFADIPHLSDAVATKQLNDITWEVVHCGSWDTRYSKFHLVLDDNPRFIYLGMTFTSIRNRIRRLLKKKKVEKDFCHGVAYDHNGTLCLSFSTGKDPRIQVGKKILRLPPPWGPKDVCTDPATGMLYAVAVDEVPKLVAYDHTATSVWKYHEDKNEWEMIAQFEQVHTDACQIYNGRLWMVDQLNNRVIGVDILKQKEPVMIHDKYLSFPHGLSINANGLIAVTNYGNSSIIFSDLNTI